MGVWQAVLLGILQGLTEFLPVSSSGHIEIAKEVLGVEGDMRLTMMLHAGTVLSTVVVFGGEIWRVLRDLLRFRMNEGTVFAANLVIASLPVAFVGIMFRDQVEGLFGGNLVLTGAMLLVTAGLLVFSGRVRRGAMPVTPRRAFVIGLAQAVAVLPGLSRSGSTISAGLLQGVDRAQVAKFSFLMALIPVLGELVLDAGEFAGALSWAMVAGFAASFLTGLVACRWMVRLVSRGRLSWFAIYCALLGLIAIGFGV